MARPKLTFEEQRKDALMYANTIIKNNWTCNKTAEWYGVAGSTVTTRLHVLKISDPDLYVQVQKILGANFDKASRKAEEKRMLDRRRSMKLKAQSRPTTKIVKPVDMSDYSSISNRTESWPNTYIVKVKNILNPGKFQTFIIRAKSPKHAKEIYLLMRNHYGYTYLSSDPKCIITHKIDIE